MATQELDPKDYDEKSPQAQQERWTAEFKAAKDRLADWHKQGDECVARYLDEREGSSGERRLNLYTSGIQTQLAMLYGNTPDVSVERRFADAQDDEARVAAEMLERILNADLERTGDNFQKAQSLAGWDHLVPGLGGVWLRYVCEKEPVAEVPAIPGVNGMGAADAVPAHEKIIWEDVETDWVYWKDWLFNAARVWHEVRWVARRTELSKEARDKRFAHLGPEVLAAIPTKSSKPKDSDDKKADPLAVTEVWEIWSKRDKKVYWFVDGFNQILDTKDDPLGLEDFFPCPELQVANVSTTRLVPRPDWVLYQDQYRSIDDLTTRIDLLLEAVRAVGVYDKEASELKDMLGSKSSKPKLYPVDSWARFAEKGGIRGSFEMLPLADIVNAISVLRDNRAEQIQDLYQSTGMSDIMRGQATSSGVTATEQSIKARFGSVRMQARQDKAAAFATNTQRLRAEIISKHFSPDTIIQRSNAARSYDQQMAIAAATLIKEKFADMRVAVKSESMSLTDFAALKQERMEVLTGIGGFLQVAQGVAMQMPGAIPSLLKILQHTVAGLRGADGLESILDQMIVQAEQAQQQPQQAAPPDPKVQAAQIKMQSDAQKGQMDLQKEQMKLQADLVRGRAEVQNDAEREQNQMIFNVREARQKQIEASALKPAPVVTVKPRPGGLP